MGTSKASVGVSDQEAADEAQLILCKRSGVAGVDLDLTPPRFLC